MEVPIIKPLDVEVNQQIRDREVRVIDEAGTQLGIMSSRAAYFAAKDRNLDLVKISPTANPPVCKIMDFGKFKFEQAKREKEAKKNQKTVEIKEIQLSVTIDVGDLNIKAKRALEFLEEGNKVKVTIRLKGRQQAHPEFGVEVMNKFFDLLKDQAMQDKRPSIEGRNILMMLSPKKN